MEQPITLAKQVGQYLLARQWYLATAESCTGGWVAETITAVAGSSQWFERGFVCYSNIAKQEMLGVNAVDLQRYGAVSEQVACALAEGALQHSHAHLSLSVTGIAGPDGGSDDKPVGTVWFAWSGRHFATQSQVQHFTGNRQQVRLQAVMYSLEHIRQLLEKI